MQLTIRRATPDDRPALLQLFSVAFSAPAEPEVWAWKYDRNPNPAPASVAVADGRIAGFCGSFGTRYFGAEGSWPGTSATDVMTDPGARKLGRRSLFASLIGGWYAFSAEAGIPFGFGFPNARHRDVGMKTTDYRLVEHVSEWSRPLETPSRLARLRRGLLKVVCAEPFGAAHEPLAEAVHAQEGWRTERSARVLNWRFGEKPGAAYRTFQLLDRRGHSRAYAVLRAVGERALLVDLQSADPRGGALPDLVNRVADTLAGTGARTLDVRAASRSALAARLEGEMGFARRSSDTSLVMRPFFEALDFERVKSGFDFRFGDHEIF